MTTATRGPSHLDIVPPGMVQGKQADHPWCADQHGRKFAGDAATGSRRPQKSTGNSKNLAIGSDDEGGMQATSSPAAKLADHGVLPDPLDEIIQGHEGPG